MPNYIKAKMKKRIRGKIIEFEGPPKKRKFGHKVFELIATGSKPSLDETAKIGKKKGKSIRIVKIKKSRKYALYAR